MARLFTDVLREVDKGRLVEEATDEFANLINDCITLGKGGTFTLQLAVKPNGEAAVFVAGSIKCANPQPNRGASLFFVAGDGSCTRHDPRQDDLPLVRDASRMKESA